MAKAREPKDNFIFYEDWLYSMQDFGLTCEQIVAVISAAVEYNHTGQVPSESDLDTACRMMFATMRRSMDKNADKYAQRRQQASEAGKASAQKRAANTEKTTGVNGDSETQRASTDVNGCNERQRTLTDATESTTHNSMDRLGRVGFGKDKDIHPPSPLAGGECECVSADDPDSLPFPTNPAALPQEPAPKPKARKKDELSPELQAWMDNVFWPAYPRHEGKQAFRKALAKLNPDETLRAEIMAGLARAMQGNEAFQNRDIPHIPHPATWLNGTRWEDEFAAPAQTAPAQNRASPRPAAQSFEDWTPEQYIAALVDAGVSEEEAAIYAAGGNHE